MVEQNHFRKIGIIGLGWLGLPLAKRLLSENYTIIGSTTSLEKKSKLEKEGLNVVVFNLNDETWNDINSNFNDCDVLIITIPPSKELRLHYASKIEHLIQHFPDKKILFTSSTSIYNDLEKEMLENSPLLNDYAIHSPVFQAEKCFFKRKENTTILRLAGLFGKDRNLAVHFAGKTNIPMGNQLVNLVHQVDVIEAVVLVLKNNCWGEIINICSSDHPSRSTCYTQLCIDSKLAKPSFNLENPFKGKIISNQKSKDLLGLNYTYDSPLDFIQKNV